MAKSTDKTRQSWLDDSTQSPLIDEHVQKLSTFVDAMADGRIDDAELQAQEQRLVALMKEVEPQLDAAQHDKVTRLLCELTAYNIMQTLHSLESARPRARLQG
jgi:hypothetical protein